MQLLICAFFLHLNASFPPIKSWSGLPGVLTFEIQRVLFFRETLPAYAFAVNTADVLCQLVHGTLITLVHYRIEFSKQIVRTHDSAKATIHGFAHLFMNRWIVRCV